MHDMQHEPSATAIAEEKDNGFAHLADIDLAAEAAPAPKPELSFDERLAILEETVTKHPLNREILYKMLAFCAEERALTAVEEQTAAYPEFKNTTQNQHHMAMTLVRAGGLDLIERDEQGAEVTDEQKAGLTEDEVDDLVCSVSFRTTEVGTRFVQQHHPKARLVELLDLAPERAGTYQEVLEFVSQEPRTYPQIENLLRGRPALETVVDGERMVMQPSVFVDKLERSGALVWSDKWKLTEEGEAFLLDLKANEDRQ